jgi:hypothetical protein
MSAADRAAGRRMILAQLEGQRAAHEGRPATACPYDPAAEDPVTRARARLWLRGYDKVNPLPVDYSG